MKDVDVRQGNREFRVPTSVKRSGLHYMGPEVLVTARDADHAKEVAQNHGYTPNPHFPPVEIRKEWGT